MTVTILVLMATFALPLLLCTMARLVVRGRSEFRARVLETIASAVRRDLPIEPQFLWLIAHDERGRRRRRIRHAARRLDEGLPLSAALTDTLGLSPAATATIAAAEGGPRLDSALRAIARDDRDTMAFFHGVLMRLVYPTVILGFLGGFVGIGIAPKFREVMDSMDTAHSASGFIFANDFARYLAYGFAAALVGVVLSRVRPVSWVVDGLRGLRPHATASCVASWLGALAAAVRAGRPLDEALHRTAAAIGHPRHTAAVRDLAMRLSDGEPVAAVWRDLPAAEWLCERAAILCGPPEQLAAALDELAELSHERATRTRERILAVLAPTSLLLCGLSIALVMGHFFVLLAAIRESTVIG
jgi:type II secretory pathway component PulF